MKDEHGAHIINGTWILVKPPPGRKPIGCKWVFKIKQNADGTISRYKGRLCAKGYAQIESIDFTDTFAPVIHLETLRALLAFAAKNNLIVCQLDVSTAYLHADVEEEIYMEQPPGFEEYDENGEPLVCLLKKSIYGLKQAGRN
jgi:histone deacetylase 1/2